MIVPNMWDFIIKSSKLQVTSPLMQTTPPFGIYLLNRGNMTR